MKFTMPFGDVIEIIPSRELSLDENFEVGFDEEVTDLVWTIVFNNSTLPWSTKTKAQAYAIALGCQWGAYEMYRSVRHRKNIDTVQEIS